MPCQVPSAISFLGSHPELLSSKHKKSCITINPWIKSTIHLQTTQSFILVHCPKLPHSLRPQINKTLIFWSTYHKKLGVVSQAIITMMLWPWSFLLWNWGKLQPFSENLSLVVCFVWFYLLCLPNSTNFIQCTPKLIIMHQ